MITLQDVETDLERTPTKGNNGIKNDAGACNTRRKLDMEASTSSD